MKGKNVAERVEELISEIVAAETGVNMLKKAMA